MEISTTPPQNIYTVLSDLQNNHRRYLQLMEDAVEMLREQRTVRGGFRSSLEQYRGTTTASTVPPTASTGPVTPSPPTVPSTPTAQNEILSFEFVSFANAASILAAMGGGAGALDIDISHNTTIYEQPELPEQATCPITLEPIEVGTSVMKITRCGHVFKEAPLRRWLRRDGRCPVCRGGLHN
jgi:hypothetical protein